MNQDRQAIIKDFNTWADEYKVKLAKLNLEMIEDAQRKRIPAVIVGLYASSMMKAQGQSLEDLTRQTENNPAINTIIREVNIAGMKMADEITKETLKNCNCSQVF